ncbi:hypothetical protein G6O69_06320 [Pseudenhygromyxa sp. WMMC2535]|uniref:hypothetical protein n=1 Tax=Pseudenhygromyxa sp. WMMC2535 TaxID=2712867 RepID=UPI0015558864|nr:hypothetical protein [Pseudenhygromyxa sp. WMMC2535]NVB37439.1 hypothetical protein [Pseudenhygromyxa sp. WMMC2535]
MDDAGGLVHPFKEYGRAFADEAKLRAWSEELDALFADPEVIVVTLGLPLRSPNSRR